MASYPFAPRTSAEDPSFGSFSLLLPWDAATTRVVLLHGDKVLSSRALSSHAPTVQVLSPNGGENLGGATATVRWTAADADGDALSYIVQYSSDAGANWQTLASQWKPMTYTLDLTRLSGSNQALIRVIASDGMNTAQDQSDATFSVARHNPVAQIIAPENMTVFSANQAVILDGSGTDVEDGQLTDAAFSWSSNRNGVLGTGKSLVLNAANLQEGAHTITLTARDSDGQTGVASVSVQVLRAQPAIPAHLDVAPDVMQFTAVSGTPTTSWQPISIANSGDGDLDWTATASAPWMLLSAPNGMAPANLLLAVQPGHLAPGTHVGTVTLTSATANNSPQVVTVRFSVLAGIQVFMPVIVLNK